MLCSARIHEFAGKDQEILSKLDALVADVHTLGADVHILGMPMVVYCFVVAPTLNVLRLCSPQSGIICRVRASLGRGETGSV